MLFEPRQEGFVTNQTVFDDFGKSRRQLAFWQGVQRSGVDQHSIRLIERTDHVLAQRMIDAGLAAHRRVHLGQQGSRNLNEVHTALITGGCEPGHIPDHAAAQGNHRGPTVMPCSQQCIENGLQGFPVLEGFAIGKHDRQDVVTGQRLAQTLHVQRRNCAVGDDRHLFASNIGRKQLRPIQQAFANMNRVATLAKLDLKCLHVSPHYLTIGRRCTCSQASKPTMAQSHMATLLFMVAEDSAFLPVL
jgi:hypothetical protein